MLLPGMGVQEPLVTPKKPLRCESYCIVCFKIFVCFIFSLFKQTIQLLQQINVKITI